MVWNRSVAAILSRYHEKFLNIDIDLLDPRRLCVDVRPVHTGALPTLKERIRTMGYLQHNRIVIIKDNTQNYVIVDGRHRVICVQQLKKEGKFYGSVIPAILLDELTPEHLQFRLATGK